MQSHSYFVSAMQARDALHNGKKIGPIQGEMDWSQFCVLWQRYLTSVTWFVLPCRRRTPSSFGAALFFLMGLRRAASSLRCLSLMRASRCASACSPFVVYCAQLCESRPVHRAPSDGMCAHWVPKQGWVQWRALGSPCGVTV